MKFNRFVSTLGVLGVIMTLSGCADEAQDSAADYVLTNGKIYTVDSQQPWAEAVAVEGQTIVYVGDNEGVASFVGSETEQVDLEGRMVLPGFVESHVHLALGAAFGSGVIIDFADPVEVVQRKVRDFAQAHPERKTIFGATYNAALFDDRGPSKALLDAVVPDRPAFLLDHGGHGAWVNSKALEVAGITRETPDPPGGEYVRDANGDATGAIKGAPASLPVLAAVEAITAESTTSALSGVLEGMTEFGFTAGMDMGAIFEPDAEHEAFIQLDKAGKLPMRISMTHYVNTPELAQTAAEVLDLKAKSYKSDRFWFDTLKVSVDSVIEIQTAAMLEPYLNTGTRGMLYFDVDPLTEMVLATAEKGYNVTTHSYGDHAVRVSLDAAENLRKAGYNNTLYSITHAALVDPADRPRFSDLDVTAQTTGVWIADTPEAYQAIIGKERWQTLMFPLRDWLDSGVTVALGSDWPATIGGYEYGLNPFVNMFMAMYRRAPKHLLDPVFGGEMGAEPMPPTDQVMTLEEAIEGYTLAGAKMLGVEDMIGSIEVGKKADLILLSQNLFEIDPERIADTKVLATMFDGQIIHDVVYELGDSDLVEPEDMDAGQLEDAHCLDLLNDDSLD